MKSQGTAVRLVIILAVFLFILSCSYAADFNITNTSQFDAGTKSSSSGNYETETYTDNFNISSGSLALSNAYSDRFTFADADGDTWKWTSDIVNDYLDFVADMNTTVAGKLYLYGEQDSVTAPGGYIDFGSFLNQKLTGDFDIQVEFSNVTTGGYDFYMGIGSDSGNSIAGYTGYVAGITVENVGLDKYYTSWYDWTQISTSDTSGKLRMTRETIGINTTLSFYYWDGGWTLISSYVVDNGVNPDVDDDHYPMFVMEVTDNADNASCEFFNFKVNSGTLVTGVNDPYRSTGTWESENLTLPSSYLSYTTLNYLAPNGACITNIQWIKDSTVKAEYNNSICGGMLYQEDANETQLIDFDWQGGSNTTDGDWDTFGYANAFLSSKTAYLYVNYTIPVDAATDSLWQVKGEYINENLTIPAGCWNDPALVPKLMFQVQSIAVKSKTWSYSTLWSCWDWDLDGWTSIASGLVSSNIAASYVYEEAMWWAQPPSEESITIHNLDLTSGTFENVTSPFTIKLYLSGGGTVSPIINEIFGNHQEPNTAPSVSNILLDDETASPANQIDLNAGSTRTVWCNATVTDAEGYADIISSNSTIYSSSSNYSASDDRNNHYTNSSCALSEGFDTTKKNASCSFSVYYYAEPGNWTCVLYGIDASSAAGNNSTNSNVSQTIALDISGELNFGTVIVNNISNEINTSVYNIGNTQLDISLNGTNISCDLGTGSVTNLRYNTTDYGQDYGNMTSLTNDFVLIDDFALAKKTTTDESQVSKNVSWKLKMPLGVKGTCTGAVQFTAFQG